MDVLFGLAACLRLPWGPWAHCVASVSIGGRSKSGTGDSRTQVGLFKPWCILFCYWHFSCLKKMCDPTCSAEARQTVVFLYSENKGEWRWMRASRSSDVFCDLCRVQR